MIKLPKVTVEVTDTGKVVKLDDDTLLNTANVRTVDDLAAQVNRIYSAYYVGSTLATPDDMCVIFDALCTRAAEWNWPVLYRSDLYFRNLETLITERPERFVWALGRNGTHMMYEDGSQLSDPLEKRISDTVAAYGESLQWYVYTPESGLFYVGDGVVSDIMAALTSPPPRLPTDPRLFVESYAYITHNDETYACGLDIDGSIIQAVGPIYSHESDGAARTHYYYNGAIKPFPRMNNSDLIMGAGLRLVIELDI